MPWSTLWKIPTADLSAGSASQRVPSQHPNGGSTQITTPARSTFTDGLSAAPDGNSTQHPGARPGGSRTRRPPGASWVPVRQGWVVGNSTPPRALAAIAGEMLATNIIATRAITNRTLITRFIDRPPCSTYLSAFFALTITDPSCRRYRTNELFLQFFSNLLIAPSGDASPWAQSPSPLAGRPFSSCTRTFSPRMTRQRVAATGLLVGGDASVEDDP